METMVKFFDMQQANLTVAVQALVVDATKKTFSCQLGTKSGKAKMRFEDITGTITQELSDFFSLMRPEKIEVLKAGSDSETEWIPTGNKFTSFERWLLKGQGQVFVPGTLADMYFESKAHSEDATRNPFKIIRLMNGKNVLSLVWVASKKKTETVNANTGEVSTHYTKKYYKDANDQLRPSFTLPQYYRRLIIQAERPVQQVAASSSAAGQS